MAGYLLFFPDREGNSLRILGDLDLLSLVQDDSGPLAVKSV